MGARGGRVWPAAVVACLPAWEGLGKRKGDGEGQRGGGGGRREKEQSEHRLKERGRMGGGGVGRGRVAITPAQQVRTQRGAADDSVVAVGAAAAPACPRGLGARRMPAHGRRAASVGWQRPSFGVSAGGGQNGVSPPMPHTRHPVGCESRLVGTGFSGRVAVGAQTIGVGM